MNEKQLLHYQAKLSYETDSWDIFATLEAEGDIVVVDGCLQEVYENYTPKSFKGLAVNFSKTAI